MCVTGKCGIGNGLAENGVNRQLSGPAVASCELDDARTVACDERGGTDEAVDVGGGGQPARISRARRPPVASAAIGSETPGMAHSRAVIIRRVPSVSGGP